MKQAHDAPRCQYLRLNDQPCTQPALRNQVFCRFHDLVDNPLPDSRFIPFVEDAASLQVAIMQVIKSLQLGKMDRRTAGTILYALQIAASNLKYLAAETGRPYDLSSPKPTKKKEKEEEELPGPSLAETLLQRLDHLLEEDPPEESPADSDPWHLNPNLAGANQNSKIENQKCSDRSTGVSPVTPSSEPHRLSTEHSALSTSTQQSEIGNRKWPEPLTNNQAPTTKNDFPDAQSPTPKAPGFVYKLEACAMSA